MSIAEIINDSQATVKRINTKLKLGVELKAQRTGRCGRKRITSSRDGRKITKVVEHNRKMPARKLKSVLENQGINISLGPLKGEVTKWNEVNFLFFHFRHLHK